MVARIKSARCCCAFAPFPWEVSDAALFLLLFNTSSVEDFRAHHHYHTIIPFPHFLDVYKRGQSSIKGQIITRLLSHATLCVLRIVTNYKYEQGLLCLGSNQQKIYIRPTKNSA